MSLVGTRPPTLDALGYRFDDISSLISLLKYVVGDADLLNEFFDVII